MITTSTASGKTLAFLLPVPQKILGRSTLQGDFRLSDESAGGVISTVHCSRYWNISGEGKIRAGVYDGDTMPAERSRIKKECEYYINESGNVELCISPNHSKYGFDFIFANLRYIVIDELHSYRAHLRPSCEYFQADAQNLPVLSFKPPVFMQFCDNRQSGRTCKKYGTAFSLIEKDGSPSPVRGI